VVAFARFFNLPDLFFIFAGVVFGFAFNLHGSARRRDCGHCGWDGAVDKIAGLTIHDDCHRAGVGTDRNRAQDLGVTPLVTGALAAVKHSSWLPGWSGWPGSLNPRP
jgi:hypothetical protein